MREQQIKESNELLSQLLGAIETYRSGQVVDACRIIHEVDWSVVPEIEQFSMESLWLQLIRAHGLLNDNNVVDAILQLLKVADGNNYESLELHIRANLLLAHGHRRLLNYKSCVTYLSECIPYVQKLVGSELKNLLYNIADFAESTSERIRELLTVEVLTMSYVKSKNALLHHEEEVLLEALCHRYISIGEPDRARALFQSSVVNTTDSHSLSSPRKRATFGAMLLASGDVLASMNLLRSAVEESLEKDARLCVSAALAYARAERQDNAETESALALLLRVEEKVVGNVALKYEYGLFRQIALRFGMLGQFDKKIHYVQRAIDVLSKQEKLDAELVDKAKQQQQRLVQAKLELERISASNTKLNDTLTALGSMNSDVTRKTAELVSVLELLSQKFHVPVQHIHSYVEGLTANPHASARNLIEVSTDFKNTVLLLLETIKAEQMPSPEPVDVVFASVYASSELSKNAQLRIECTEACTCAIQTEVQGLLSVLFSVNQLLYWLGSSDATCTFTCDCHKRATMEFELHSEKSADVDSIPRSLLDLVYTSEDLFEPLLCLLCMYTSAQRLGWNMELNVNEKKMQIRLDNGVDK